MELVCLDAILAEFWVELSNVLAPYVPDLDMGIRHGWCFEDVGIRGGTWQPWNDPWIF